MNLLSIVRRFFCLFLLTLVALGNQTDWYSELRSLRLLETTRGEVSERFGQPTDGSSTFFPAFDIEAGKLQIEYSRGLCKTGGIGWNVPEYTVTRISLDFRRKIRLADLPFKLKGFTRQPIEDVPGAFNYENDEKGIRFTLKRDKTVEGIEFSPPADKSHLRCDSGSTL